MRRDLCTRPPRRHHASNGQQTTRGRQKSVSHNQKLVSIPVMVTIVHDSLQ